MPLSPNDVFIARYHDSLPVQGSSDFIFQLSSGQFIFRSKLDEVKYKKPTQWKSTFSSQNIEKGSLIIGLAYTPDGAKPEQYQITSFATLSCAHNQLSVSRPVQPFLAWNRQMAKCTIGGRKTIGIKTIGILDGFIQYDQSHYLAKLQQKYPTCEQLNKAFPSLEMEENSQNSNLVSSWKLWWAKLISQIKSWF
ncbi:hypothetical protein F970_00968 [Acinetobacter sp. CIP 102082]|uniref:hypothetical protein n=1 Tax=unclassified Acinetobacter TaxID=196816 RepID=UPI0002CF31D9|nr:MULTISPECIES: hypothetical protein [unclassified Acinetobacter]ENU96375.1 hypothetical protein F970_00968 [Acinetobacter sp. CIP 102082]ENX62683.1 hypothetical protein F884_02350 [Acinetobacter sp. CIP 102143]